MSMTIILATKGNSSCKSCRFIWLCYRVDGGSFDSSLSKDLLQRPKAGEGYEITNLAATHIWYVPCEAAPTESRPKMSHCWNIRSFTKTELKAFQFFSGQREYCLKRLVKVIIPANLRAKMFSKNPCRYQWGHLWSRNSKGQRAPRAFLKSHPNLGACCSGSFPLRDFLIRKTFKEDVEYCSRSLGKLSAISCWPWSACVYISLNIFIDKSEVSRMVSPTTGCRLRPMLEP